MDHQTLIEIAGRLYLKLCDKHDNIPIKPYHGATEKEEGRIHVVLFDQFGHPVFDGYWLMKTQRMACEEMRVACEWEEA